MYYLYDYHVHSNHSTDGNNTVFEICQSAIKKGLKEIVITDHFEPSRFNEKYAQYKPYDYWLDVALANELHKKNLKVKLGIELGQPHLFMDSSSALTKLIPYDYVIGSAHKFPSGLDCSEIDYNSYSIEDICQLYIEQIKNLVLNSDFDCVGHIDLIKRYGTKVYNKRVTLMTQQELLSEVFKIIIAKGKGIEINTSGLRQSPKEPLPGIDVLKLYFELGGEILTIGSDAHYAKDVGKDLTSAIKNAEAVGFKYLTIYNNRKPEWIPIAPNKDFSYYRTRNAI